jgi:hypothetical protein
MYKEVIKFSLTLVLEVFVKRAHPFAELGSDQISILGL